MTAPVSPMAPALSGVSATQASPGFSTTSSASLLVADASAIVVFLLLQRLIIGARTRSALAAKRQRRERVSGIIPFGYQLANDGELDVRSGTLTLQSPSAAGHESDGVYNVPKDATLRVAGC